MSSYSSTYPSIRPVFNADFSNAGRLDSRITFSRSDTPPTYAAPSAVHYWSNEKHLSSENLIPNSNTNAAWQTFSVSKSVSGSFLDGSDSLLVSETVDTAAHYISPNVGAGNSTSFVSGTEYTAVMYAKAGTDNIIQVGMSSGVFGVNAYANYDLSNAATPPVTGSAASATITALGSGWVKLTLTATATSSGSATGMFVAFTNNDINASRASSYAGDTAANVYLWWGNVSSTGQTVLTKTYGAIIREYAPTLKSVSTAGQPRFEYSPTDSASMGLLIEGQSQNLLPNGATGYNSSDVFSWTTMYSNFAQNAAIAPTGSLEATHFYEDTEPTTQHRITVSVTATAAAHTLSGYFKSAGRDDVQFRVTNGGVNYWAKFNFSTETASDAGNPFSSLRVSSVGNGWYRFEATTPTLTAGSTTIYVNLYNGSMTYTGDGYSGVLFYGLQFEAGAASSLIATVDSAVTRAADSASMDLNQAGFSGGPFTVVSETEGGQGPYPRAWALTDSTASERVTVYRNAQTSGSSTDWYVYSGTGGSGYVTSTIPSSASAGKLAVSFNTNDVSFTANGNSASTDPSAPIPSGLDALKIGTSWSGGSNHLNGHIKRLALYGEALSDTNLQALTS